MPFLDGGQETRERGVWKFQNDFSFDHRFMFALLVKPTRLVNEVSPYHFLPQASLITWHNFLQCMFPPLTQTSTEVLPASQFISLLVHLKFTDCPVLPPSTFQHFLITPVIQPFKTPLSSYSHEEPAQLFKAFQTLVLTPLAGGLFLLLIHMKYFDIEFSLENTGFLAFAMAEG